MRTARSVGSRQRSVTPPLATVKRRSTERPTSSGASSAAVGKTFRHDKLPQEAPSVQQAQVRVNANPSLVSEATHVPVSERACCINRGSDRGQGCRLQSQDTYRKWFEEGEVAWLSDRPAPNLVSADPGEIPRPGCGQAASRR